MRKRPGCLRIDHSVSFHFSSTLPVVFGSTNLLSRRSIQQQMLVRFSLWGNSAFWMWYSMAVICMDFPAIGLYILYLAFLYRARINHTMHVNTTYGMKCYQWLMHCVCGFLPFGGFLHKNWSFSGKLLICNFVEWKISTQNNSKNISGKFLFLVYIS